MGVSGTTVVLKEVYNHQQSRRPATNMATWRNGSAFGFDRLTASNPPLQGGTKRLQVRVLRWSYFFAFLWPIYTRSSTLWKPLDGEDRPQMFQGSLNAPGLGHSHSHGVSAQTTFLLVQLQQLPLSHLSTYNPDVVVVLRVRVYPIYPAALERTYGLENVYDNFLVVS